MVKIRQILTQFFKIDNLYIKFILTVIAISLVVIAIELSNRNYYNAVELINGAVRIEGTVDVSGEVNTYEQNNIIGSRF